MSRQWLTGRILCSCAVFIFSAVFCCAEVIKPEKVTASSELTKFKGHLAKFAADGKVDGKEYWCTDFANNAKTPHWLEFDFGSPKKFNQIQLYMYEQNNLTQLFNDFKIEYWDGQSWKSIVDKKNYISKYMRVLNGLDAADKYKVEAPDPYPVFRFDPISAAKVKLTVSNLSDGSARLREMLVSMSDENTIKKNEKKIPENAGVKHPGIYCFDFGPAETETMPGFVKVSSSNLYNAEKGYGWISAAGMLDCDRHLSGPIRRDFVAFENLGAEAAFKVKLAPGRYYLYIISGDAVINSPGLRFSINGHDFEVPPNYRGDFCPETFACDIGKAGLNIQLKGSGVLNGLVIAPVKQWREFSEIINSISVPDTGFKRDEQPTHREKPQISDAEKKQGYICYVNSLQQRIFPDTTPRREEIKDTVEAAATPGEIEGASFSIYGINDIADLKISLGDLKSETGEIFPAKDIDLNLVRCWPQRSGHKGNAKTWSVVPELLEPFRAQDIPSGSSRQFWLNFNVPANVKAGLYTGELTLQAANAPGKRLRLKLRIYPFTLKTPEDYFFAMYYGGREGSGYCIDPKNRKADMMQLLDMKRHGMNSVILAFGTNWLPDIAEKLRYCNKLLDEAGYPKQPIPVHHQTITPELAVQIRDLVKKENLREILFYPVDEPFNQKLDRAIEIYKKLKTVPGIRTYSTVTQNDVDKLGDTLDVRTYTIIDYAKFEPERISEECRKAGKSFWWYSNASREYPDAVRFKAGYFYWKTNSRGQAYWAYANLRDDAFNDFDTSSADHCTVYFKGGKLFSTIQWEEIREGINDFKYIYTLEQLIKENIGKKPEECAKARKLLDEIKADTVVDLKEYQKRFGEQIAIHIKSFWTPEKFDEYRKKIAEEIIRLNK